MTSIKVCKYFIKSSPVGELHEVLDDIGKVLSSQDFLSNQEIRDALREYYETHKLHLHFPNDTTVIVSAQGRQEPIVRYVQSEAASYTQPPAQQVKKGGLFDGDDEYGGETDQQQQEAVEEQPIQEEQQQQYQQVEQVEDFVYYDPVKKLKFSFNPITLEAKIEEENVDWETSTLPANVVQLREEVIKAMNSYLNRLFRKGTSEYSLYSEADGSQLRVEISCHNLNFKSFWGGEWLSSWVIDLTQGGHVSGSIKIRNHYFEQGNIQFNMNKDFPSTKVNLTGRAIVDHITKQETNYQDGLEDMYTEVSEKLLKGMRRIMPVTRQRFDWGRPHLM